MVQPQQAQVAGILSAAFQHWEDFGVILALLLNAGVGFWEEYLDELLVLGA